MGQRQGGVIDAKSAVEDRMSSQAGQITIVRKAILTSGHVCRITLAEDFSDSAV